MAAIREKAKKFQKFVQGLQEKYPQAVPDPGQPLLDRFVYYLLSYSNPLANSRKAYRSLTDEKHFASWSEVRVATVREITEVLEDAKISPADFLAPRLKQFLQKLFEEVDDVAFEPIAAEIEEAGNAKVRKDLSEKARKFILELPGIPPWGPQYLLTGLGLDTQMPWESHTEAVLEAQKAFPAKATVPQKKRVAKALLESMDPEFKPLDVHHLLVEYGKRELGGKKKPA